MFLYLSEDADLLADIEESRRAYERYKSRLNSTLDVLGIRDIAKPYQLSYGGYGYLDGFGFPVEQVPNGWVQKKGRSYYIPDVTTEEGRFAALALQLGNIPVVGEVLLKHGMPSEVSVSPNGRLEIHRPAHLAVTYDEKGNGASIQVGWNVDLEQFDEYVPGTKWVRL